MVASPLASQTLGFFSREIRRYDLGLPGPTPRRVERGQLLANSNGTYFFSANAIFLTASVNIVLQLGKI